MGRIGMCLNIIVGWKLKVKTTERGNQRKFQPLPIMSSVLPCIIAPSEMISLRCDLYTMTLVTLILPPE